MREEEAEGILGGDSHGWEGGGEGAMRSPLGHPVCLGGVVGWGMRVGEGERAGPGGPRGGRKPL